MARFTLVSGDDPDHPIVAGGDQLDIAGSTTKGESLTIVKGDAVLDASFAGGGDFIFLPGFADEYVVTINGSRAILTRDLNGDGVISADDGDVRVNIPIGPNPNTLIFLGAGGIPDTTNDDDDVRSIGLSAGLEQLQIGDQIIESGDSLDPGAFLAVPLTSGTDILMGNIFNAPRGFTPGGSDQVNTLNDDDFLTGIGDNPTLNVTLVNDADTEDRDIDPTLTNIQTINIDAQFDDFFILDLQDATGVRSINIDGLDDEAELTIDNIGVNLEAGLENQQFNIAVRNSRADDGRINVLFDEDAVDDRDPFGSLARQTLQLILDEAELNQLVIDDEDRESNLGIERLDITVEGEVEIGTLFAEDAEEIFLDGTGEIILGEREGVFRPGTNQVEAYRYSPGLGDVAGSLLRTIATEFSGPVDYAVGDEAVAFQDGTSGQRVDYRYAGSLGDDIVRFVLGGGADAGDVFDGGGGENRVVVFDLLTDGSMVNFQTVDARSGHDDGAAPDGIEIDFSVFQGLQEVWVRNEGMQQGNSGLESVFEPAVFDFFNMSATHAANINLQHGTTGNNGVGSYFLLLDLASNSSNDLFGIRWVDHLPDNENRGINIDRRFNFTVQQTEAENLRLDDDDSESNTANINVPGAITGTIDINGGRVGDFLNLDVDNGILALPNGQTGLYGIATDGGENDFGDDNDNVGLPTDLIRQSAGNNRLIASVIDATDHVGDVILRVGEAAQTIWFGSGNDTVVFDALANDTAGLTVADDVVGGDGDGDTIAFEGNVRIIIGGSEWLNVFGFETVLLIGNEILPPGLATGPGFDLDGDGFFNEFGENAYNLRLTPELLEQNGVSDANGVTRLIIRNDNHENGSVIGGNTGVTIDATLLDANESFRYDGGELGVSTADRLIMSDININGNADIRGGAAFLRDPGGAGIAGSGANSNFDVLEIRATAGGLGAQVTLDDLANVTNMSELSFTNQAATDVNHFLALDNGAIERLVNTSNTATTASNDQEALIVSVYDNQDVLGAETMLTLDLSDYDANGEEFIRFEGDGTLVIRGLGPNDWAGLDFSGFNGDVTFADPSNANIAFNGGPNDDDVTGSAGNDVLLGNGGDDRLDGAGGNDLIFGGPGGDRITGGPGADTFLIFVADSIAQNNNGIGSPGDGSGIPDYDFYTDFDRAGGDRFDVAAVPTMMSAQVFGSLETLVDALEGANGGGNALTVGGPVEGYFWNTGDGFTGVYIDSDNDGVWDTTNGQDIFFVVETVDLPGGVIIPADFM